MSGAWATAADSCEVEDMGLAGAVKFLTLALRHKDGAEAWVTYASAIIRRERKCLLKSWRMPDRWPDKTSDELLWEAIKWVAVASTADRGGAFKADILRHAEAALRTWWKRNGS